MSPTRALILSLLLGGAILAAGAMIASRPEAPGAPERSSWSEVQFADCASVVKGPVCELPADGRLHLWVPQPTTSTLRVATDRGALPLEVAHDVEGGTGFAVTVSADARALRVSDDAGRSWSLALAPNVVSPWADEIERLRQAGQLEAAETRLASILEGARGADRARALGLMARTELTRSDYESAVTHFRAAIALDHAEGIFSREALDALALSFALNQRLHRYAEARAALAGAEDAIAATPENRARLPFYLGVLLDVTADPHSALQSFEEARQRAARLGMKRLEQTAESSYAVELAVSGRRGEALARLRALAAANDESAPCDRADILDSIGIWTLRSLDASGGALEPERGETNGAPSLGAAREAFDTAARLYPQACADAYRHADLLVGLAEVSLREGDLPGARARLAEARGHLRTHSAAFDDVAFDLEARLALAGRDPRAALSAYREQERATGGLPTPEFAYSTAVGRGEALEALNRAPEALAEYEHAETLLDQQSLWIPLGSGRLTFLADRQRSARNLVDLLLRIGRLPEAMAAARASRIRAVAMFERGERIETLDPSQRAAWEKSLETYRQLRDRIEAHAEDDWKLPADGVGPDREKRESEEARLRVDLDAAFSQLAQSRVPGPVDPLTAWPGELVLSFHPVRDGWVGFSKTKAAVTAYRFALPERTAPADEVAARLLGPVRAELEAATHVRIFACDALRAVDFHALPFAGAPLIEHAVVTYGADVSSLASRAEHPTRRALIVADPNDNLAATIDEAGLVARAIAARPGWETISLLRDEATSARAREAMTGASWFHYAGHGSFDPRHQLGSALLLANGTRLTVGDVLALSHSPDDVVLLGCETGRSDGGGAADGLGLAQAFVAVGSRVAVAPVRMVEDATAARLASLLYRDFDKAERDLPGALRDAQRALREAAPQSDWGAFRAVTP